MSEVLGTISFAAAGTRTFAIPTGGRIKGIYSPTAAVSISWIFNDTTAKLVDNVTEWEPTWPLEPAATSYLEIVATAATEVAIRYEI